MKTMEIIDVVTAFFSGALKSVEVKIAGFVALSGFAVEQTGLPFIHGNWYYILEAVATVGKAIIYGGGAVVFLYKGIGGVIDWWKSRKI